MKFLLSIIFLLIFSTSLMAKSKRYEFAIEEIIKKSADDIVGILMDRESYCESCRYPIDGLKEVIIIERNGTDQLFVYNDIYKMGAYPNFRVVTLKKLSPSVISIVNKYVDENKAKELSIMTGYEHKKPFDRLDIKWTLTKVSSLKTKLRYEVLVESNNPFIKLGWSQVVDGTRAGAKHVFGLVKR